MIKDRVTLVALSFFNDIRIRYAHVTIINITKTKTMETVFENDRLKIVVNKNTNEVHITNKEVKHASLRLGATLEGFNLTTYNIEYIPKTFNGLAGFNLKSKERKLTIKN